MKFSICIPNYNYAQFLDKTLRSILDQTYENFEIVVSDNASTDASVEVIKSFDDPRIRIHVNPCNVGLAANLDCAARMAAGDRLLLVSSDDLLDKDALATYARFLQSLPDKGARSVVASSEYEIDSDGKITDHLKLPSAPILLPEDRLTSPHDPSGHTVYRVPGPELLRRCITHMRNPFHFVTAAYPRRLYEEVGGYGGGRLFNPDKWFHWRLLAAADTAYYFEHPLFSYRVHASNQLSLQRQSGALKYLVDDYLSSVELSDQILTTAGLSRTDVEKAYVEMDIGRHGLATLARRNAFEARRIANFGKAVYPRHARRNVKVQLLRALLPLGPLAHSTAKWLYSRTNYR
jgi:glycosyltransferase involved in cell wall biosynthesis